MLAPLGIPLSKEAQQMALLFASEQDNVEKGRQVFLNTVAIIAVYEAIGLIYGWPEWVVLERSKMWTKKARLKDVSLHDLPIGDGTLLCVPILPKQKTVTVIPPSGALGVVGVLFHERLNYVEMLGFYRLHQNLQKVTLDVAAFFDEKSGDNNFEELFLWLPKV